MHQTRLNRLQRLISLKTVVLLFIAVVCVVSVATAEAAARPWQPDTGALGTRCEDEQAQPSPLLSPPEPAPRPGQPRG